VKTHFTPYYNPWDQRLCLVPDSDFFQSIKDGKTSIVTDHIDRFTSGGIKLKSGKELEADIIVTATGLKLELLGGMKVVVDGEPRDLSKAMSYKGMMYSDVPNRKGTPIAMPKGDPSVRELPWLDFSSGYVQRALDTLPKQGATKPWKLYQNYALDLITLRYGKVDDGTLIFSRPKAVPANTDHAAMAAE
jgi:hypothetical protein